MGMINVDSFRSVLQSQGTNLDDNVSFDADAGKFKSIAGSGETLKDFEVILSDGDKQRNCEVRGLLLNALSKDLGADGAKDPAMKAFLEKATTTLLGDCTTGEDAVCFKPLTGRSIQNLLNEANDVKLSRATGNFTSENSVLVGLSNDTEKALKDLASTLKADDRAGIDDALTTFHRDVDSAVKMFENDAKAASDMLKAAHKDFVVKAGGIRIKHELAALEGDLKKEWSALNLSLTSVSTGVDDIVLVETKKKALFAEMDQVVGGLKNFADTHTDPDEEGLKFLANPEATCRQKINDIKDKFRATTEKIHKAFDGGKDNCEITNQRQRLNANIERIEARLSQFRDLAKLISNKMAKRNAEAVKIDLTVAAENNNGTIAYMETALKKMRNGLLRRDFLPSLESLTNANKAADEFLERLGNLDDVHKTIQKKINGHYDVETDGLKLDCDFCLSSELLSDKISVEPF